MIELPFPLLGAAFVMFVVLPACAALAKVVLLRLERKGSGTLHGLDLRYLLMVGATWFPIAWFVSAGLHQAEFSRVLVACLFTHDTPTSCFEPALFVVTLLGLTLAFSFRRRPATGLALSKSERARALEARLHRLTANVAEFAHLHRRLIVTESPGFAIAVQGLFRPQVVVGCDFAEALSDGALVAALSHELEHVRSLDPLRYQILHLALAVNPLGRYFLAPHAAQWFGAREAHCDREAVINGANPMQLAEAIVRAARPASPTLAMLSTRDTSMLRLRVSLLLAFAERRPTRCCGQRLPYATLTLALALAAISLPHETNTALLDVLHVGTERVVLHFWR